MFCSVYYCMITKRNILTKSTITIKPQSILFLENKCEFHISIMLYSDYCCGDVKE